MVSTAKKDMSFVFQLDQLSFTHGPTSDHWLTTPEIDPAQGACLLQKSLLIIHMLPFHKALMTCLSSPVWVERCFNESGSKQRRMHLEGRWWEPKEPEWSKAMSELVCMATGLSTDRTSHILLSRKYFQKKTWLLARSLSSPACVEIQRFQESMVSTHVGTGKHWPSAGPWPTEIRVWAVSDEPALVQLDWIMHLSTSNWPNYCPTIWPQQELHWNQTRDRFCPPHPIYCTKAKC